MLEIKELQQSDYSLAIDFAIKGMHFDRYIDNKFFLKMYGRYFFYSELNRSTQIIAAYHDNELQGVLLAAMKGENKRRRSKWRSLYVRIFDKLQNWFSKTGAGSYDQAIKELLKQYKASTIPDGEICFLATNPHSLKRGTGTILLNELIWREKGKEVYLFTDDACTYQFYEHRDFNRFAEKKITMEFNSRQVPLRCFLYNRKL